MDSIRAFQRLLTPILARIRRVIMGSVIKMVDDSGDLQKMQVQTIGRSVYDNIEKFGQFGFTSNPPAGLDSIIVERNGKYISIAIGDRKYRIKNLASGDVAIYDMRGQIVKLNADGITVNDAFGNTVTTTNSGINLTDKNGNNIIMDGSGINLNGVIITQDGTMTTPSTITAGGDITSGSGKTLDTHMHEVPGAAALVPPPAPTPTTTPPTV